MQSCFTDALVVRHAFPNFSKLGLRLEVCFLIGRAFREMKVVESSLIDVNQLSLRTRDQRTAMVSGRSLLQKKQSCVVV